jgi:hypothetical protein
MGFKQTYSDAAVYIFVRGDVRIILPVFVDDMTFASTSLPAIKQAIADLSTHFKLRDLGPTTELLGIKIDRNRTKRSLTISQPQYCAEMLSRYGMGDSKPVSTPMTPALCLSHEQSPRTADERAFMRSVDYGGAIGSLQYLSCTTRPDIAYTVGQLASFTSDPGVAHWHAIKHLLRYCYAAGSGSWSPMSETVNCNATEHTNIPGVRCQKLKSTDIGLAGSMYRVTNNHT